MLHEELIRVLKADIQYCIDQASQAILNRSKDPDYTHGKRQGYIEVAALLDAKDKLIKENPDLNEIPHHYLVEKEKQDPQSHIVSI